MNDGQRCPSNYIKENRENGLDNGLFGDSGVMQQGGIASQGKHELIEMMKHINNQTKNIKHDIHFLEESMKKISRYL